MSPGQSKMSTDEPSLASLSDLVATLPPTIPSLEAWADLQLTFQTIAKAKALLQDPVFQTLPEPPKPDSLAPLPLVPMMSAPSAEPTIANTVATVVVKEEKNVGNEVEEVGLTSQDKEHQMDIS
ncbi:hypothetical protein [Phaffia rhodozyma]|uniref:Uncharacterized protein n=1 Tax=Phaffia rhodozyma TaxID=264483 RepID=A0A0F7SJP7_PHARH|nr:hypothetical protein [Phaffia rhodozyma]